MLLFAGSGSRVTRSHGNKRHMQLSDTQKQRAIKRKTNDNTEAAHKSTERLLEEWHEENGEEYGLSQSLVAYVKTGNIKKVDKTLSSMIPTLKMKKGNGFRPDGKLDLLTPY